MVIKKLVVDKITMATVLFDIVLELVILLVILNRYYVLLR